MYSFSMMASIYIGWRWVAEQGWCPDQESNWSEIKALLVIIYGNVTISRPTLNAKIVRSVGGFNFRCNSWLWGLKPASRWWVRKARSKYSRPPIKIGQRSPQLYNCVCLTVVQWPFLPTKTDKICCQVVHFTKPTYIMWTSTFLPMKRIVINLV